jgi:soluble lytic murein transglycosylase-like protein
VRRCRHTLAVIALLIVTSTTLVLSFAASEAHASTLSTQLRHARLHLHRAELGLTAARAALAQALAPTPAPTPAPTASATTTPQDPTTQDTPQGTAALRAAVHAAKNVVHRWHLRVRRLATRLRTQRRLASAAAHGKWRPIINYEARKRGVKADGVYRMMMLESGGRANVVNAYGFSGLFQYCSSTWHGKWNPWRSCSIFDGWAQIKATTLALHRGYGPRMWSETYSRGY